MVQRRSRLEIFLDILKVISKGTTKPTRIMYGTNLSWKPLMKTLNSLIIQGLVLKKDDNGRTTYHLTSKGKEVLSYLKEATSLIEIV